MALGLYYYNARYYAPSLGRFLSADTLVPDPQNPQSLNRYAYVLNRPLNYSDPTGHRECNIECQMAGEYTNSDIQSGRQWNSTWDFKQQQENSVIAESLLTTFRDSAVGILWEPADWAIALSDGFQWYRIPL